MVLRNPMKDYFNTKINIVPIKNFNYGCHIVHDRVHKQINRQTNFCNSFLDLSKASDLIKQSILVTKSNKLGIEISAKILWERTQSVVL